MERLPLPADAESLQRELRRVQDELWRRAQQQFKAEDEAEGLRDEIKRLKERK